MRILRLQLSGWRNLAPLQIDFDPAARLNVLSGDNGQGKTNIIEAVYYLAAFRSFRTTRPTDLVQERSSAARIAAEVETRHLVRSTEVRLLLREPDQNLAVPDGETAVASALTVASSSRTAKRSVWLDGKPVRSVAAAFGVLSVVLFVPEDLLLVRAAPASRRRFLDMAISGVEPAFFAEAAVFQRVLRSRNAVLRAGRPAVLPRLLDAYDEQLATAGARMVMRRRELVRALGPDMNRIFRNLHGDLPVALTYISDAAIMASTSEAEVSASLMAGLVKRRSLDERRGHTTFGPQTDDLDIHLADRPAREHASQGQMRSLVLAMKLAELAHVALSRGESPVLLLDDVPSELDPTRRQYLFETLSALSCQTMVSVADPNLVPALAGRVDFKVLGGKVNALQVSPLQERP